MILKCKICGGDIVYDEEKALYTCEYCGSSMTLPKVSDEQKAALYNRGNHFRRIGEFDKALAIYENIVREDNTDAEAHWCCVLCRFGIEYVEDPATYEYLPTCHRASFDSVLEDVDYLAALEYSEGITKRQYQKDAAKIAEVQRGILATSQNEDPFDVFICYKETDDTTKERTRDSVDAQEIYYQLTQEGFRVFFSRITLENIAGTEYEPYIFAALNSAKVMIVIGSKPEYFNAVWVKNEWSRFISLMKKDRNKLLIPCYKEMDPYDLPEQLSILQSYDMKKIGFVQDLIRGIKKVAKSDESKQTPKETVVIGGNVNVSPLLKRAFMFLEDGEWSKADEFCEQVLNQDPENSQAYLGKLMAELHVQRQEELQNCEHPFDNSNNYQKVIRFGDKKISEMLLGYIECINERNENARLTKLYNNAVSSFKSSNSENLYKEAAKLFNSISGFRDADELAKQCLEKAEECRKDSIYGSAVSQMTGKDVSKYEAAIRLLSTIKDWRDANDKINACQKKIEEIKVKVKKRKRNISILAIIIVASIVFAIVLKTVIIPKIKFEQEMNLIMELLGSGDYEAAYSLLETIGKEDVIVSNKYKRATELINSGYYVAAYMLLDGLEYKDSASLRKIIKDSDEWIRICPVGKTIFFGSYEQDNNTANGKEDIEWIVLAKENDQILVISQYALDCQQYNQDEKRATWDNCSLNRWLNETFINDVFSADEQAKILINYDIENKVFLLNNEEAKKYFSNNESRRCKGTDYCYAQGAQKENNGNCWWWLRSYKNLPYAECIRHDGFVDNYGFNVKNTNVAVRPALWIDIDY